MVPLLAVAAIAAAGGLLANQAGKQGVDAAKRAEQMYQKYQELVAAQQVPQISPIEFQQYVDQMDSLNPEEVYKLAQQAPSELANYKANPQLQQAQMQALQQLQEYGKAERLLSDRVGLESTLNQIGTDEAARQAGIQQDFARRGQNSAGLELAARQSSAQNASNQARAAGMQQLAQIQSRAAEALLQSGTLAGRMEDQSFDQAKAKADAQDRINAFNAQLSNGVNAQRGALQVQQAQNKQNIMGANTDLVNSQKKMNQIDIPQQNYNNQMAKIKQMDPAAAAKATQAVGGAMAQQTAGVSNAVLGPLASYFGAGGVGQVKKPEVQQ